MSLGLALHGKWDGVSMAAPQMHSYKHERPAYSTPQPVENTPANNECRMVELRGAKVASFILGGDEFICLPQAFDLFLKHLVGGLHTVYTKLKRLSISPVVCNVEQVRVLRGLGAIQPGVNRCKLITRKDFEILYQDCTQASRPGRPPKRYPMLPPTPDLASHYPTMRSMAAAAHGILGATDLNVLHKRMRLEQDAEKPIHQQERRLSDSPQRDGSAISSKDMTNDINTNATSFYLQAQQAIRQQYQQSAGSTIHNGSIDAQQAMAAAGMNPALAPLMMMSHPALFSGAFPPGMLNHINQIAQNHGNSNAVTSAAAAAAAQIAVNGGNMHQQAAAAYQVAAQASLAAAAAASAASSPRDADRERSSSLQEESNAKEGGGESPKNILTSNHTGSATNPTAAGSGVCGSPHSSLSSPLHGDNRSVKSASIHSDSGNSAKSPSDTNGVADNVINGEAKSYECQSHEDDANRVDNEETDAPPAFLAEDVANAMGNTGNISSMQTLLTNIQGLLKVAADNARLQEKHSSFEIAELKNRMTLERQMRTTAEKKLKESEDIRALIQRRLKKERKLRKHLQEQLSGGKPHFGFEKGESTMEKIASAPTIPITGVFGSNREQGGDSPERSSPKRQSPTVNDLQNDDVTRHGVNVTEESFAVSNGEGTPSPPASMVMSTMGDFGSFPVATFASENSNNNNNTKPHFVLREEAVIMAAKQQFVDERKYSKDFDSESSPRGVHRELPDLPTSYTSVA